jgi:hypothetical protein
MHILEKLKAEPVKNKLAQYKQKWLYQLVGMENTDTQKKFPDYQPTG